MCSIAVITTCFGRWHHLLKSWQNWKQLSGAEIEFVIVAAGPDDAPIKITQDEYFDGVLVRVRNCDYYRPSYLRNVGAKVSRSDYLAFVDADILLDSRWAAFCVSELVSNADLIVHSSTYNNKDAGGVSGTLAISRWLFEKVNGYSENLDGRWGYEDTDLIIRAQRAGGRVSSYPAHFAAVGTQHSDEDRISNFKYNDAPKIPTTYLKQMKVADDDKAIHLFEANRIKRLDFTKSVITLIDHRG